MNKIERVCVRARVSVYERKSVCLRERASEREWVCVRVRVCVCESIRGRETDARESRNHFYNNQAPAIIDAPSCIEKNPPTMKKSK